MLDRNMMSEADWHSPVAGTYRSGQGGIAQVLREAAGLVSVLWRQRREETACMETGCGKRLPAMGVTLPNASSLTSWRCSGVACQTAESVLCPVARTSSSPAAAIGEAYD